MPIPILREDQKLFRVVEFLQYVREKLTPPPLRTTKLHQKEASVQPNFWGSTYTQVLEKFFTGLSVECVLEHGWHRMPFKEEKKIYPINRIGFLLTKKFYFIDYYHSWFVR